MKKAWYEASEDINGIPLTRYIASWYIAGGKRNIHAIREWLRTLVINGRNLTDDEVQLIADCTVSGKLELEESVKNFKKR